MDPLRRLIASHPVACYAAAWVLFLGGLAFGFHRSWHYFDHPRRRDGNDGHTRIDFAGQWLIGRLLAEGHGRHLYDRNYQRDALERAYPPSDEAPGQERSDPETIMHLLMGKDDPAAAVPVGGPLYPPVHAFLYAPLGALPPRAGYRVAQVLNVLLIFSCGLALKRLSGGRLWWPAATLLLMAFPGFGGSLNLGQNATLTLIIFIWGWVLLDEGHEWWAGAVWGLFAYKPVWAAAFFLVPLLTLRWRTALAMLLVGVGLAVATLPVVGVEVWLHWLQVGREASALYDVDENWINVSRDLLGAPRRWLLDFDAPPAVRDPLGIVTTLIGWGLLLGVLEITSRLTLLRPREARATRGSAAAFLLLGAWLCCFHFIYYDVLLAALPVSLLFLEPGPARGRWRSDRVGLILLALIILMPNIRFFVRLPLRMEIPWEQYLLFVLWLWCGRKAASGPEIFSSFSEPSAGSVRL